MALNKEQAWWVRAGGNELNGGGFDSTISGAGTNYADQDSSQLNITDGATSGAGVTTLTSAAAGFTSQMVGNIIRISAGTNFQTGYYAITAYTNSSTVTLDRTPSSGGAGSGGTGRIGGAHPSMINYSNGGSATAPAITTPLAAGHTVNIRGAGTSDPSSADYTQNGYRSFPAGDATSGKVKWVGYNGRPMISDTASALTVWNTVGHSITNVKFQISSNSNGSTGILNITGGIAVSCIFDQNGNDSVGAACSAVGCWFKNTGSATAGTLAAIRQSNHGDFAFGNYVDGWKGGGIEVNASVIPGPIAFNIVVNTKLIGIKATSFGATASVAVFNNTVHGNTTDGIKMAAANDIHAAIYNNTITGNGGYGINCAVGSTALSDRFKTFMDYNNLGTGATANTSGAYNNVSAGAHDLAVDPQFTNAAGGDFSVGTNMKAVAYPGTFVTS